MMAIDPRTDPNATLVTTPLPSQLAREKAARAAAADGTDAERVANAPADGAATDGAAGAKAPDPFRRPANEDDDGYDPYSDRPADNPLFERDPWS
ncbi:hypothetical protein [Adlercreutzia faecimuris]|uniref:Uncharacterized protein n=1 Tax=Adlercreutzia faecimuris TaxID=2897341 RepID=A0ABS9WE13_9ACTN|nr:hypothetical protein [Adlercreutzia sp. JBNU-10]MCI2240810.1 hypothetical protein [Adlercreutzia sp. JBNU-10]